MTWPHAWQHFMGGDDYLDPVNQPAINCSFADIPAASSVQAGTYWINAAGFPSTANPSESYMLCSDGAVWRSIAPSIGVGDQVFGGGRLATVDWDDCLSSQTLATNTIYLYRAYIDDLYQEKKIGVQLANSPAGLVGTYFGMYDHLGNKLMDSGDVSATLNGATAFSRPTLLNGGFPGTNVALSPAGPGISPNFVWFAALNHTNTTPVQLQGKTVNNRGSTFTTIVAPYGTYTAGSPTSLPATITPSSITVPALGGTTVVSWMACLS